MELEIKKQDGATVGVLNGRLDSAAAGDFVKAMQPLMEDAAGEIVLDCTALEYVSSSGLRALLTLRKQALDKGGKVVIEHINDDVRNVFKMTGFLQLFEVR